MEIKINNIEIYKILKKNNNIESRNQKLSIIELPDIITNLFHYAINYMHENFFNKLTDFSVN